MKQFQLLSIICLLFISARLTAQTASVTEGCTPLNVQFTAPSGVSAYFWDFGNSATSTLQNPDRVFNSPGTYEVTLREQLDGNVVGTVNITVYPQPELILTPDPAEGCLPLVAKFSNTGFVDPAIDFTSLWSFDALGTSDDESPTFVFEEEGTYDVALSIQSNLQNCSVTELVEDLVVVSEKHDVNFTTSPSPVGACIGPLNVDFTVTSDPNLEYFWDFGNGSTFTGINPTTQTYTEDGTYLVSLTGTSASGCVITSSTTVSVGIPDVAFTIEETACINQAVEFTNQSAEGNYTWAFGDGATSNAANPTHEYAAPGTYAVTLTVQTAFNCSNSVTEEITIGDADATFTVVPTYSCDGEVTLVYTPNTSNQENYEWTLYDGTTSNDPILFDTISAFDTLIYSVNMEMTYTTSLTVSNNGCTNTAEQTNIIHRPNAEFKVDTISGCLPLEVVFSDLSISNEPIVEWLYDFQDGTTDSNTTGDDITHTFTEAGEYDVVLIVTNEAGCQDTSYAIQILVGDTITDLDIVADQTTICVGDTINVEGTTAFEGIDGWHFEADGGRSAACYQSNTSQLEFATTTGAIDVSVVAEYNGCITTVTKEDFVTVNGPLAVIDYEMDCDAPFTVQFRDSSMDATSIIWDFGDGMTSEEADPIHTYEAVGDYTVLLTATNEITGCPASLDSVKVCIRDLKPDFELDTLICAGQLYNLVGTPSSGIDKRCHRGYTWDIPNQTRPITTQLDTIEFLFGTPGPDVVNLIGRDINGCVDTTSLDIVVYQVLPDFTFDPAPVCFPVDIAFTDQTQADTTVVSWEWDFGDGTTSTDQNPSHTFSAASATVTLSATDVLGCDGSNTLTVPEYQPSSQITASPSVICVGADIDFSATDFTQQGSSLSYEWNFGNGETSTNQSETVTYTEAGTYEIVLNFTEIATGCTGMTTTSIEVQNFPVVDFTSNLDDVDPICTPTIGLFTNASTSTSPVNYIWDLGNGTFSNDPESVSDNFTAGTYTVSLTASTIPAECADTETFTFTALASPEGNFTISDDLICNGESVTFTLTDTTNVSTYTWDFADGETATDENPVTHTYDLPNGNTTISTNLTLTSLDGACTETISRTITVVDPVAAFTPIISCGGQVTFTNTSNNATTYAWDFGDGNLSTDINPTNIYAPGVYNVTLVATEGASGCDDMTTQTITIADPVVASFVSTIGTQSCDGTFTFDNLSSANANAFEWSFGDGNISTDQNPTHTYDEAGVYTVTLTAIDSDATPDGACDDSVSLEVEVFATIAAFESNVIDPCEGIVQFTNLSLNADSFEWDFGDGNTSSDQNPVHTYAPGTYEVTLVVNNLETGCTDELSSDITITDFPELMDASIVIIANGEDDIDNDDETCTFVALDGNTYTVNQSQTLEIQDANECSSAVYTYQIIFTLDVPNIMTPNNDGLNDFFNLYIANSDEPLPPINILTFEVYNRWGVKVYNNETPDQGWDGRFNDKYVTQDVYVYRIEYEFVDDPDGERVVEKGDVTVIR